MSSLEELANYAFENQFDDEWYEENVPKERRVRFAMLMQQLALDYVRNKRTKKRYIYLLTITVDPNKHPSDSPELIEQIEKDIQGTPTRSKALNIIKWAWVREYTEKGRAHWHVCVESTGPLQKYKFGLFEKKYGHIDFSRNKSQNPQTVLDYISKEQEPTITRWEDN